MLKVAGSAADSSPNFSSTSTHDYEFDFTVLLALFYYYG